MKARTIIAATLAAALAACVGYHQERPALRMAPPSGEPAGLAAYAGPDKTYPSVGGDILKGTSPEETAAYEASIAASPPSAPAAANPGTAPNSGTTPDAGAARNSETRPKP